MKFSRFYPIIDMKACGEGGPELASQLARAGCLMLQVRAKAATGAEMFDYAARVIAAVRGTSCRVVVNDRLDIALACRAAGVHLGEHDLPVRAARTIAPPGFIIGATARETESARDAHRAGADYIGAGAVFPTSSKSGTRLIGLKGLARIARAVEVPVFGIAGVSPDNCASVTGAGAWGAAGITALTCADDPAGMWRELEKSLEQGAA